MHVFCRVLHIDPAMLGISLSGDISSSIKAAALFQQHRLGGEGSPNRAETPEECGMGCPREADPP